MGNQKRVGRGGAGADSARRLMGGCVGMEEGEGSQRQPTQRTSSQSEPDNVSTSVNAVSGYRPAEDEHGGSSTLSMSQSECRDDVTQSRTGSRFDVLIGGGGGEGEGSSSSGGGLSRNAIRSARRALERTVAGVPVSEATWATKAAASVAHRGAGAMASVANSKDARPLDLLGKPCDIPAQYAKLTQLRPQPFVYILICDFEATCDDVKNYPNEIIEFPVVALDTATLRIVDTFHAYVRPVLRPTLTRYCTDLTGITQAMVDSADTLPVVLQRFQRWLYDRIMPLCRQRRLQEEQKAQCRTVSLGNSASECTSHGRASLPCAGSRPRLSQQNRFAVNDQSEIGRDYAAEERLICFATDGPWDMRKFMFECSVQRDGIDFPPLFYRFINVRFCYCQCMRQREVKLALMLQRLHMTFQGRQHSGLDDAMNITRVLATLLARGFRLQKVSTIEYNAHLQRGGNHDSTGDAVNKPFRGSSPNQNSRAVDQCRESRTIMSELLTEEARSGSSSSKRRS